MAQNEEKVKTIPKMEVARLFGVHLNTVRKWVKKGLLTDLGGGPIVRDKRFLLQIEKKEIEPRKLEELEEVAGILPELSGNEKKNKRRSIKGLKKKKRTLEEDGNILWNLLMESVLEGKIEIDKACRIFIDRLKIEGGAKEHKQDYLDMIKDIYGQGKSSMSVLKGGGETKKKEGDKEEKTG